jgi:hypothetical protein
MARELVPINRKIALVSRDAEALRSGDGHVGSELLLRYVPRARPSRTVF